MTLHITKTKAEQQLAVQFEAVAAKLPGVGWMRDARRRSFGQFIALGLPHRRIEAWKYTDLRNKLAGNEKLEDLLGDVLNNTEKLKSLGDATQKVEE